LVALVDLLKLIGRFLKEIEGLVPRVPEPDQPPPVNARVTHMADGDSFVVEGGWRVPCIGIDAPE